MLSKEQIGDRSLYRIVYVEASQHIKQDEKNVYYVPDPAPNLEVVFAKYASAYDQVLSELPNYQEVIERHCEFIAPCENLKVLDLGAGTGNLTIKLLEKGACVTAVDRSNEMIRVLRKKCSTYQRNLKTYTIDASNLSCFESNRFDVVNILLVLFAIEEPENVLREAFRVLRPGGKLVMTEPNENFDIKNLLDKTEEYLSSNNLLAEECMQKAWKLVKNVNLAFESTLSKWIGNSLKNLLRLLGDKFDIRVEVKTYQENCTAFWAIKPGETT